MKKLVLFIISILIIMGITVYADSSTQYNFNDYSVLREVYPGRLFSQHTKASPVFEKLNNANCLKIGSASDTDNIVLMNSNNFKDGSFSVSFSMTASGAPNVNWGLAPSVMIRYLDANGRWVNDRIIEYAYSVVRVRVNDKEEKVVNYYKSTFNSVKIDVTRSENTYTVNYKIGTKSYKKEYTTCDNGEVCVGFFSYKGYSLYLKNISFEETFSTGQKAQSIKTAFNAKNPAHPRILMDGERLSRIRSMIKDDDRVKGWYENVKKTADSALSAPVSKYELRDGERLLYVSRDVYVNSVYPAFVYLIEGEEKYKERAWQELKAAAEFSDWHPEHFLDTAEMTLAFALCYDWLYYHWDKDTQLPVLKKAIKELGLDAANGAYENAATYDNSIYGAAHNRIGWKNDASNWGLVCNGGIAVGAMAIMDSTNIDYCAKIIEDATVGLGKPLSVYAEDGAWSEGVGYWHYATQYLTYMTSSLDNTLGSTYGYLDSQGIKNAPQYLIAHTGPMGTFNYGDCSEDAISAPELFYLADYYGDSSINDARLSMMDRFGFSGSLDDILFYNKDVGIADSEFEKNARFDSVGVVTGTNSADSALASYIAMKSGDIGVSHGDLDAGSFILDAMGVRWVSDYGSETYTLSGYFDWSKRVNYYRKRAEGHSTLVINPSSVADQKVGSTAPITRFESGNGGMFAVTDLSGVYAGNADSVQRAVALYDDNTKFMVQDEVKSATPCNVYWFMQTRQSPTVSSNGKTLVLSKGNKKMLMVLDSNCSTSRFVVTPASPLSSSPNPAGQTQNTGYYRIAVVSMGVTDLVQRVVFIPYIEGFSPDASSLGALERIDSMSIDLDGENYAKADTVYVNGKKLDGFKNQLYYYNIEADGKMPIIEAISDSYNVDVEYGKVTCVTVTDPENKKKASKYYFIISGDADASAWWEYAGDEALVYTYNSEADVYLADYDEYGRLSAVRFFEDVKNTLRAKASESTKVFVWDDMKPVVAIR